MRRALRARAVSVRRTATGLARRWGVVRGPAHATTRESMNFHRMRAPGEAKLRWEVSAAGGAGRGACPHSARLDAATRKASASAAVSKNAVASTKRIHEQQAMPQRVQRVLIMSGLNWIGRRAGHPPLQWRKHLRDGQLARKRWDSALRNKTPRHQRRQEPLRPTLGQAPHGRAPRRIEAGSGGCRSSPPSRSRRRRGWPSRKSRPSRRSRPRGGG